MAASSHPARVLRTSHVRFARFRAYQWVRRSCLALAVAYVVAVPFAHRSSGEAYVRGVGGDVPPLVGAPWSVRLFGLELLDPLAAVGLLSSGIIDAKIWIAAAPLLLLVALLGRFFCGWMCPYLPVLASSNALRDLLASRGWAPSSRPLPKRTALAGLVVLLVAGAIGGTQLAPLVYPPSVIGREVFRAVFFGGAGAGALVIAFAFVLDTFVARAGFCNDLCPGGAVFRVLGAKSVVRVKRQPSACTHCTACNVVCNARQAPMEDGMNSGCDRCGLCISVCPTGALSYSKQSRLPVIQESEDQ